MEDHRQQTFAWDEKGQLTAHAILTPEGTLLSKQTYRYDDRGNIVEITLQGCLTKLDSKDIVITRYTYSKENNLVLTENQNNEVEYIYSYHSGTTLLASKLTVVSQNILEREFYSYDKNGILTCKTMDDGCKSERDNLEQVSYRLITEIEPHLNPNLPGMTLPHFIQESYQDPKTGKIQLLKKIERLYTQGDLLTEEKIFDSTDTYLYSQIYKYNSRRELINETNAYGETAIYAYDDQGNKIYEEKTATGKKTHFIYDEANRLIQEKEEHTDCQFTKYYENDALGNLLSSTDIYGQKTAYQYDLASREISCKDPLGYIERKEYDSFGNAIKAIDKAGYVTKTCYNLFNNPLIICYPDGSTKKFAYNGRGHLVQEWNRDGTSAVYQVDYKGCIKEAHTYGSDGEHLKTLSYEYKGPHLIKEVDAMGNVTSYIYDGAGRKTTKIQGNVQTLYDYDNLGRLSKTSVGNRIEITVFDFLDRIMEERIEDPSGNIFRKIQYEYDPSGNLATKREFSSPVEHAETHTLYNSQHMPILEIDPLGHETKISYRQTDHLEKETLDPSGKCTVEIYDPMLRIIETKTLSPSGTLLADTSFTYDNRGNQIGRQEKALFEGLQLNTYKLTVVYDAMNQKILETEQDKKITEWTYENGRLQTLKMADGVALTYKYDALGRLQKQLSSDHSIHYAYSYDLNDNLLQAQDLIHQTTTTRAYDSWNRPVFEKQATGFEFEYCYDDLNRITKMTFGDGTVNYEYSLLHLTSASRYKENQLLYAYTQQLDWRGKIQQAILPNQTSITYQWDNKGRCTLIDSLFYKQNLTYDVMGNLIETEVQDGIGSYKTVFDYDGLNQLTCEVGHFENEYRYDSLRNRRGKNETSHSVDTLNQLQDDGVHAYQYDQIGRRINKEDFHYTYDALGRLIAFQNSDCIVTFQYDPLGRRISSSSSDSNTTYIYQLDTEIGAYQQNQLTEFRLVYKKATLAIELDGRIYAPIRNWRGDICQLQNDTQIPTTIYRYDAFGVFVQEGVISSPWLFSGQRYDSLTGFFHFDKREYDPHVGRWLTPDPLGFAESLNLFTYVKNNPLIYVDPYGLWWTETKDFVHGTSRGFLDDTSWNSSRYYLGTYNSTSTAGRWGYHVGTGASMAVGLLYGGAEVRLLKGALSGIKKIPTLLNHSTKPLRETHRITKSTVNNTPVKQVFDQIKAPKNATVINKEILDLDKLSKAGQVLDRNGLTRAGRALDKHGGRPNSVFPKTSGNHMQKNNEGQFHLDDILTDPKGSFIRDIKKGDFKIYSQDDKGVYFRDDGSFRGFIEKQYE